MTTKDVFSLDAEWDLVEQKFRIVVCCGTQKEDGHIKVTSMDEYLADDFYIATPYGAHQNAS